MHTDDLIDSGRMESVQIERGDEDTIVALATAPGRSALALVRVSGPAVSSLLATHFEMPDAGGGSTRVPFQRGAYSAQMLIPAAAKGASNERPRPMARVPVRLPVRLCVYVGPASYTGEDGAEILLPGNPALVERVIGALCAIEGARAAEPGEFSARAYLRGKLTLEQAEGVSAVIGATSEAELEAARRVMSGEAGARSRAWADEVATLLALVEAGVDFTDQEDVVAIEPRELVRRAGAICRAIEQALGTRATATTLREGAARVVLVGPPNAGKSTLMNALLGRERAVVSDVPGTTRDVLVEPLDLAQLDLSHLGVHEGALARGSVVELVDLAGLEAGEGEIGREAQRLADESIRAADVLLLCDPEGVFEGEAFQRARGLSTRDVGIVRVRTKADRVRARDGDAGDPRQSDSTHADVEVCALDGWNLHLLARQIACAVGMLAPGSTEVVVVRHQRALAKALHALREAIALAGDPASDPASSSASSPAGDGRGSLARADPAMVASALRGALDALGSISGAMTPDDVLGRIFASFCIGK